MTVEEIVARCETYQYSLPRDEQRALIASWRERGEALKELVGLAIMPDALTVYNLWPEALERARAALDKP